MHAVPRERGGENETNGHHPEVNLVEHHENLAGRRAHHLADANLLLLIFAVEDDEAEDADDGDEDGEEAEEGDEGGEVQLAMISFLEYLLGEAEVEGIRRV